MFGAIVLAVAQECDGGILSAKPASTPIDIALVCFCLAVVAGTVVSPAPDLTLPKATGVLFGVATLRALVRFITTPRRLAGAVGFYVVVALPVVLIGFLATAWGNKTGLLSAWTPLIPTANVLPGQVPVNANALAASAVSVVRLLTMLCLHDGRAVLLRSRSDSVGKAARATLLVAWAGVAAVLLASQSLTAWISTTTTLAAMFVARYWPRITKAALVALAGVATGAAIAVFVLSRWSMLAAAGTLRLYSLDARFEVWTRAVWAIRDFPLTGVGLGAFRRVGAVLYPLLDFQAPAAVHAHNQLLQVALDIGLPRLMAYVAILVVGASCAARVYRAGDDGMRTLVLGLGGNLLALQLFGLTDTVSLGAKVGWFFWFTLGLILAITGIVRPTGETTSESREW
jgi:putative inorganic carbon (HCO3(-)) transporter